MNSTMFFIFLAIGIILFKCLDTLIMNEMKTANDTQKGGGVNTNNDTITMGGRNNNQPTQPPAQQPVKFTNEDINNTQPDTPKGGDQIENTLRQRNSHLITGIIEPSKTASHMLLDKAVTENNLVESNNTSNEIKETAEVVITNDQQIENKPNQIIDVKDPDISILKIPLKTENAEISKNKNMNASGFEGTTKYSRENDKAANNSENKGREHPLEATHSKKLGNSLQKIKGRHTKHSKFIRNKTPQKNQPVKQARKYPGVQNPIFKGVHLHSQKKHGIKVHQLRKRKGGT